MFPLVAYRDLRSTLLGLLAGDSLCPGQGGMVTPDGRRALAPNERDQPQSTVGASIISARRRVSAGPVG